jgi:hypothetical protein
VLIPGADWGKNLNAFNDILRGGFGTPDEGFVIKWVNADRSRSRLGHEATLAVLVRRLGSCHPSNLTEVQASVDAAQRGEGETIFDWLVDIIRVHGKDGAESEDGVELVLA